MKKTAAMIHVVDDDAGFRAAVTRLLRASGYAACGYASGAEFLAANAAKSPGCVVLDMQMPGINGLELQRTINQGTESLPVIFLTAHGNIPASVSAMKAGAVDFLTKPVSAESLLPAIENALGRDTVLRSSRSRQNVGRARYAKLTLREAEVFQHVVTGKLNKEIAFCLHITERTVKAHRASVMRKMKAKSVAELVRLADLIGV